MNVFVKHRPKFKVWAIFCLANFLLFLTGAVITDDYNLWHGAYALWIAGTILGLICHLTRFSWYRAEQRKQRREKLSLNKV